MKLPYLLIAVLALSFSLPAFAQGTISGKIIDSETKLPLEGASVFAQNTTRGTVTDKEGNFSLALNKGGYEVVISFTGYTSRLINYEASSDRNFNLEMEKEDNSMSEVVIRSSNEVLDGWEKYGSFFIQHFIGNTPFAGETTLANPEALKFFYYKRNDRLKVLATEPLQIRNDALGYSLRYELDSFVHHYNNNVNSYRGYCFFTELQGTEEEMSKWKSNRELAYSGSRLHFIRSYFDSSLVQEGFTVDILSKSKANKFDRLLNPYDSAYYFFNNEGNEAELFFPAKASISYNKKAPETGYLQQYNLPHDVNLQISYIVLSDAILIKPNGYFYDQKSWTNQGYWSWKNLADMLPYDYE
ncbi:MAG: carboxypeptidase-like regulatory domain-containing protein [Flavisolibacter sp.]|jgi:hypothetical protein|nr:carboxypeptidase-like regulatory domain-containing protein [Flavisolibacter sp.]